MIIRELKKIRLTPYVIFRINHLLGQLSQSKEKTTLSRMERIQKDNNISYFFVMDKKNVAGMGMLVTFPAPKGVQSRIENVVVDGAYRGRGLGEMITKRLIREAKRCRSRSIELSSAPKRIAANALYQKLGFKKRETNIYRMVLRDT